MEYVRIITAAFSREDSAAAASLLNDSMFRLAASVRPDNSGLAQAGNTPADALLICAAGAPKTELDFAERLYMTRGELAIILLCGETDSGVIERAMNAGVTRVININEGEDAIRRGVLSAINRERSRAAATKQGASAYDSKIVQFFSTKGGTGKSSVAVNYAVALALRGKKTALVDLDLQFGDVGVLLDIAKADTIADMVEENNFEQKALKSYMVKHYTGVDVLLGSAAPEYAELIKPEHIGKILTALRGEYDYLVLDMPPAFTDCTIAAQELSDAIYFVVTEEISALRNARVSFKVMEAINLSDKLHLLINKDGISNIGVRDVERILDKRAEAVLPNDQKTATRAINRGVPLVIGDKYTKLAKAIREFAKKSCEEG